MYPSQIICYLSLSHPFHRIQFENLIPPQLKMNDNQNAFVTRSTSRVLSEPGGKSSTGFLFGGSTTANKKTDKPASGAPPTTSKLEEEAAVIAKEVKDKAAVIAKEVEDKAAVVAKEVVNKAAVVAKQAEYMAAGNFAQSEAARFKAKNEAQHFSLCGNTSSPAKNTTSSNAFTSAATTNSYNVITDRPTSRVVSVGYCCCLDVRLFAKCVFS